MASSTTRLLDRLADALQRRQPASQPAANAGAMTGQTVKLAALTPPLSRAIIDDNLPTLRIAFGLFCVAYTAITTVVGVYLDFAAPLDGLPWARTIAAVTGALAAGTIFVIQLACAEHLLPLYYVSLIPDTWYSYKPIGWLSDRFAAVDGVHTPIEVYVAILVGITLSFVVARFGEVLLFGTRRHNRWWRFLLEYLFVLVICGGLLLWIG
jgi:hypothetical protein